MITEQTDMPAELDALRLAIDEEISRSIVFLEQAGPENKHPLIQRVYRWMRHYLDSGGKRMHGIAVVLAYQACGGKAIQSIIPFAAALQLYHHHTLVHDDIYDEDSARRGWPTSHLAFASLFRGREGSRSAQKSSPSTLFTDDALRRGAITAFAYGKICRAMAGQALLRSGFPAEARLEVAMSLDVHDLYDNVAQIKDVYHEGDAMPLPDACLDNAWLKTGRLFEVCAYTGARLAEAQPEQLVALKTWAGQTAIAYQLQDDLEDLNVDSEKGQGRGIAADLLHCKPTYLYSLARTMASGADLEALLCWQGGDKQGLDVATISAILERCGAMARCQQEVERCLQRACIALSEAQPKFSAQACATMSAFSRYFLSPAYWRRHIAWELDRGQSLIGVL